MSSGRKKRHMVLRKRKRLASLFGKEIILFLHNPLNSTSRKAGTLSEAQSI